ncbi:MAG: recombinase family protein, partial [Promethearchaeota archaeon]
TKDQNPELQRKDGIKFGSDIGIEIVEVASEQGSAYKLEKIRPIWESVVKRAKKEKLNIIVWRYDRAFRNREEFYKFMKVMFEVYHVKIYSVKEPSILTFWEMLGKSHSDNPVINELMNNLFKALWDFLINQAGEQAEEESKKKSDRVKLAVRKVNGVTKSYKGKKWGRKALKIDSKIIKLYKEGKTYREICGEVYYWDKSNHKKFVSLGYVGNILKGEKR